jgi:DNA-binding SARP family transcriptional activator
MSVLAHIAADGGEAVQPSRQYRLDLLGGFGLTGPDGAPVLLPARKCKLLLAYLAVAGGQPQPRSKLAALFWGDRGEEQARGSLRKCLTALRAALGPEAIAGDSEAVSLGPVALASDVARLERLARSDEAPLDPAELQRLSRPFLDGKEEGGAEFADWLSFERARCLGHAQRLLARAVEAFGQAGRRVEQLAAAQRLLSLDPLREQSHRLLMRIHMANGDRSLALAQFRQCRDLLRAELGVEPSPETVKLAEEITTAREAAAPSTPEPASKSARDPRPNRRAIRATNIPSPCCLSPMPATTRNSASSPRAWRRTSSPR